ncbi:hypothetical protein BC941DRAFT_337934, partial [Chlamydoabsidia padenii]
VIPCVALTDDRDIVRVSFTSLPVYDEEELLPGLATSLRRFGIMHHLELFKDPASGFRMGTGYAIIHKTLSEGQTLLAPLTHKIEYLETSEFFHATWADMSMWCRYCHEENHTKFNCAQALAAITCYQCHQQGYRAAQC